jgi:hypothetical protein
VIGIATKRAAWGPYALCGWRVVSELPLPELSPWSGTAWDGRALHVEVSDKPLAEDASGFTLLADGSVLLHIPGTASFVIAAMGGLITVYSAQDADPLLLRSYLYGSVLAVICYQRGLFPLHGSSVRIDEAAVVFSGPSGSGKSTLATALARRGHALLSDDVCAVDITNPARPMLWPAFARVKLLPDAIANFGLGAATAYTRAVLGTKGHFGVSSFPASAALNLATPIAAIFALGTPGGDSLHCARLPGKDAFLFLNGQAHRRYIGRRLGFDSQLFHHAATLASAVPVYHLDRPAALDQLNETAVLVEAAVKRLRS